MIIHTIHDNTNPYVQLNKKTLWDENLSVEAVGTWARLMSRPTNWQIRVTELMKSCKMGKRTVYRVLKELISAGYCYRFQPKKVGPKGGIVNDRIIYLVSEDKRSEEDFKKCFLRCVSEEAQNEEAQKRNPAPILKKDIQERKSKNKSPKPVHNSTSGPPTPSTKPPSASSAVASEVTNYFLSELKKVHPNLKEPNLRKWVEEMEKAIRLDKRTPEELRAVITWAVNDSFWKANILSPLSLREQFDRLFMGMRRDQEKQRSNENLKYFFIKKKEESYAFKDVEDKGSYLINKKTGKDLPLSLPHQTFKDALNSLVSKNEEKED